MNVIHICVTDEGGAGLCCRRIHHALMDEGISSHILTMLKFSNDPTVNRVHWGIKWFVYRAVNKLLWLFHLPLTDKVKIAYIAKKSRATLSLPVTVFTNLHNHPLVQQADLVHLHGVTGFLDYPSFFNKVNKPMVWTLHDEVLFSGLSHFDRTRHVAGKLEEKYYRIKLNAVCQAKNLGIVFLSEMMYEKFHAHEMIEGRPMVIINNPVNINAFQPIDRTQAREMFGIAPDAFVLTFVSASISNPWKGLRTLCEALSRLDLPRFVLLVVGECKEGEIWPKFVKKVGPICDAEKLSAAYSAANFFISPSLQEAFSQTPIEAMACGVPAILTPVSGTRELITEANGLCCKGFNCEALIEAIQTAMSRTYDSEIIRNDVANRFSAHNIAKQYIAFYEKMLNCKQS